MGEGDGSEVRGRVRLGAYQTRLRKAVFNRITTISPSGFGTNGGPSSRCGTKNFHLGVCFCFSSFHIS